MEDFEFAIKNLWLGQPNTAQGVVPATAGAILSPDGGGSYVNRAEVVAAVIQTATEHAYCGVVALLRDSAWRFGQWTEVGSVFTDDTADAQDADTNDAALETLTANDGHIIAASVPFNVVSYDVSTAGVGAGTVHEVSYWNGSAWTPIAETGMWGTVNGRGDIPRAAAENWALNEQVIGFVRPVDWSRDGHTISGIKSLYAIRVRATVVPTTAALARRIYVGRSIISVPELADSASYERAFPNPIYLAPTRYAAIGGAFMVINDGNRVSGEISTGKPF